MLLTLPPQDNNTEDSVAVGKHRMREKCETKHEREAESRNFIHRQSNNRQCMCTIQRMADKEQPVGDKKPFK